MVCGSNAEGAEKAVKWIKDLTREIEAGEVFTGKVVRMLDFGAFVGNTSGQRRHGSCQRNGALTVRVQANRMIFWK